MSARSAAAPAPHGLGRRLTRRDPSLLVPEPVDGEPGLFVVDATWGAISPIEVAPGVRTLGELELIAHLDDGLPLVDTRREHFFNVSTIPGARSIPYVEIEGRIGELDPGVRTAFFCNGPLCAATPAAIRALLSAGFPAESIVFYRGGMHDWITLGLPVAPPPSDAG